jgi:type IV secretion system protein VirB10
VSTKVDPETLALRARPRPVTRLNRRMLIGIIVAVILLVLGVTVWSLRQDFRLAEVRPELHNVDRIARAESLDRLPPDYSKVVTPKPVEPPPPSVPVLGEPVPGDLGAAMFRAQQANPPTSGLASVDPRLEAERAERQSRERESEDAAKAPLFFHSSARKDTTPTASSAAPSTPAATAQETLRASGSGTVDPNRRTSTGAVDARANSANSSVRSEHAVEPPVSPCQIMAGTIIPAALITGINSDLPGLILATVTEPVYDSKLGRYLLIPQGTRLVGEYASQIAFGQRRVLLVWNRLIFPDASSLTLDRLPGVDAAGNSGLEDEVDNHWRQLLAGAALSTLIGVAAELVAPDRSSQNQVIVSTRQSVQDSINQVGQELTRRNLNVQPTLTVRPGYPVKVIVSKDLVLRPYQPLFIERSAP